jgi:hypothetical protein
MKQIQQAMCTLYVGDLVQHIAKKNYMEALLAPDQHHSTLEDHPLSAVGNCFLDIFVATLHI